MIYEEPNETLAAHDDSISFTAVIITSCSEQTYMMLCFLGRNNKQYFKEFGARPGMNDPTDVNKQQWSRSQPFFYLRPVKREAVAVFQGAAGNCGINTIHEKDSSLHTNLFTVNNSKTDY